MSNNTFIEEQKSFTAFSGCDIVAAFNGKIIGELQGITYSISREKAPVYTMGSPEPRSFSRGKRGIAGSLVFTVFDRDALLSEFKDKKEKALIQKYKANINNNAYESIDSWDASMNQFIPNDAAKGKMGNVSDLTQKTNAVYADELLPFDITISFQNEYGRKACMTIYGVELLNEGGGFSIDSVTSEKAYTYVARRIDPMRSISENEEVAFSSSF